MITPQQIADTDPAERVIDARLLETSAHTAVKPVQVTLPPCSAQTIAMLLKRRKVLGSPTVKDEDRDLTDDELTLLYDATTPVRLELLRQWNASKRLVGRGLLKRVNGLLDVQRTPAGDAAIAAMREDP